MDVIKISQKYQALYMT